MYVDVNVEFDVFLSTRARSNPSEPVSGLEVLGEYCLYLGENYADADTEESDWVDLWDRMGLSSGDAAEVVATTLSKMPA
jgi:hypothetical protein